MKPEDFKGFNLPHTNAEERENARVIKALAGPDTSHWPWYYFVLMGVGIGALAAFSYYDFTTAEQTGRAIWLPKFVGMLYGIFGKWGVVGFFAASALLSIGVGIYSAITPDTEPPAQ